MCRETCSDVFAPVCGNDGVTYSSECELRVSSCTQQRRIVVGRQGPCDVQDPCEEKDCRFGSFCSTSFDGRTAQCVCPDKCPMTSGEHQASPVCGSDGRNYQNECELLKVSCREMRAIEVKFKGVCDPCEGVECPTSQTCQLDDLRKPLCRCNSVCSPDFRPVCGSDGKTYTNECTMRVEACKSRKSIRIIYTGECTSGANPCDSLQCGPYQTCDIDHQGKATCQCEDTCEHVVRLVCGSDGRTHPNECEMRREGCLQKKAIKLLYRGECGERGACYRYHCSYGAICVVKGGFPTCECPSCAEEFEPVCGTDGISYTNHCKLKRESCEQKSEIAVAYTGLCTGCENKRCEYYAVCESDGRGNGKCVCPESCIQVESLVCGSDEVTYLNECEMRVAACKKAQYVMVVSKGPCDLCQGVHCKYGARCEEGRCVCPTDCPEADEVVCANDGTTYRNECEMRGAACRHDQELNVLFYGECDEVGETQDEGSGMEADCHERTCRYGGVCEYDSEGMPYCACAFRCPVVFDPVCGSDGRLHDNECKLKEESCRQQKNLMPVHIEMCEEFREVPCDGEVPLLDPMTNKDYYCGDEIGAKLCPPGSYCHKSTAFAKCCREVILIRTCSESTYGCCPDGKTAAQGPNNAGCPSVCNCNRLGSYGLTCEPTTNQCFCKPGVGGPRCDRCEPGYWGLHRMTSEEDSDGCSPCACNLYGSVRDDCEQMTGRCVCKQGILGMKCDACPVGMVLGPDGCIDESIAQPVSGSCDDLVCYHGAVCREKEGDMAQCVCEPVCSSQEDHKGEPVCASDGNTYGSECQMEHFACRYQTDMTVTKRGPCEKGPASKLEKEIILRKAGEAAIGADVSDNHLLAASRQTRHLYNKTSASTRHSKNRHGFSKGRAHPSTPLSFKMSHLVPFGRISVDIEFVPHGKDGVIFYCGNKEGNSTVALFLLIRNQFLELRVHGLNESFTLRLARRLEMGRLHRASVRRFPHVAALHLDRKWTALRSCVERYHMATFPYNFVVGAVPERYGRHLEEGVKLLPFIGCILQLRIGKHDLSLPHMVPQPHPKGDPVKRNSPLNASKDWYAKKNVRKGTCFRDKKDYRYRKQQRGISAHRALSRTDVPERLDSLLISFRMFIHGEIFGWTESSRTKEVRLEVDDGKVELSVVCDGGKRNLTFRRPVLVDGEEAHRVRLQMMRGRLEVFLDATSEMLLLPKSCYPVLVGGRVSILGQTVVSENPQEGSTPRGCIEELRLSNHIVDLKRILRQNFLCHPS